jgi:16S rRNA (uracil1498-N3)-methyltransferase
MARLNSFFLPPERWAEPFVLDGPEARHLLAVLRAKPGVIVRLFDGAGREGVFRLARAEKNRAWLDPVEVREHARPASGLVLALGWNKTGRRDLILEKSVELGALGLIFWQARRSQGQVPAAAKDSWREKFVQAAKQCGNPWLPELSVLPAGAAGLPEIARGFDRCYLLWESQPAPALPDLAALARGRTLAVLGPEGGLDPDEVETLTAAGFRPVSLGRRVLRWETAALLCLGLGFFAREVAGP